MKRLLHTFLSLFMAATVMGSAIGVPLYKHICLHSGIQTVAVGEQEHLCGSHDAEAQSDGQAQLAEKCCNISLTHEKVAAEATLLFKKLIDLEPLWLALPVAHPAPLFTTAWVITPSLLPCRANAPPPPAGRHLLALLHILRV